MIAPVEELQVAIPMRDGVVLNAVVHRPEGDAPVPAILSRTCYESRRAMTANAAVDPERAVPAGYALVIQDVRGIPPSQGEFDPFVTEANDGYDSIEWVAAQDWCDGSVVMSGRSYVGATQWLAATEQPPALKAIAPVVTGSNYFHGWVYQGGAFQLGFNLFWVNLMSRRRRRDSSFTVQVAHLPITEPPLIDEGEAGTFYRQWLSHSTDDEYWQALSINQKYDRIGVPALNVGGWYDVFLGGTLENFLGAGARLIVGPWVHGNAWGTWPTEKSSFEGKDEIDLDAEQLAFFDAVLRGGPAGPPVRIFVMGANVWRDEEAWPLARAADTPWYLRAGGVLAPAAPEEEAPDAYTYDPADPAPTLGGPTSLPDRFLGTNSGPLDQGEVEKRDDVLVYTSEPLDADYEVTGPLTAVIWAATSARDTDFVVKLTDVSPDSGSRILAEGVIRARFRDGYDRERLIEAGEVLDYRVDLVATSNTFLAGHRIRVIVTSSSFPRFDRNPNTGRPLGEDGPEDLVTAQQTIFHDSARPSHIVLPVVPAN
jgi:putative CocE/NonD family hydrolase